MAAAAQAYQERVVIPHCTSCSQPCCKLHTVVLELTGPQVEVLYAIGKTPARHAAGLARALAAGTAPPHLQAHLKEQHGTFYAHGAPCPAYDTTSQLCTVYGTPHKPQGCSDFPLYLDGDGLTADLRCEAIDPAALAAELSAANAGHRVVQTPDAQFPVLVTFTVKPGL